MCFLSPSCCNHLVLRGPDLSLICLNRISVLIFHRVGKVTEPMNVGGERPQVIQFKFSMFPRRETETSSGEVPSHRPPREGVAEPKGSGAFILWAVLIVRGLF